MSKDYGQRARFNRLTLLTSMLLRGYA